MQSEHLMVVLSKLSAPNLAIWKYMRGKIAQHINSHDFRISPSTLNIFHEKSDNGTITMGIFCIVVAQNMEQHRLTALTEELKGLLLSGDVQCRIYHIIDNSGSANVTFTYDTAQYNYSKLVFNAMTPSSNSNGTFNSWYGMEHIPLLQRVPFWRASTRYVLYQQATPDRAPQYLALHGWDDAAAFETEEYSAATNTSWRTEVISQVVTRERILFERWTSS